MWMNDSLSEAHSPPRAPESFSVPIKNDAAMLDCGHCWEDVSHNKKVSLSPWTQMTGCCSQMNVTHVQARRAKLSF